MRIVLSNIGKRMLKILDLNDVFNHRRHIDQVRFYCRQFDFANNNKSVISESVSDSISFNNGNVASKNNLPTKI